MIVVGVEHLSFPDRNDKTKSVTGVAVYGGKPIPAEKGEGIAYSKKGYDYLFLSEWFIANVLKGVLPRIGDEIEASFNRDGKLSNITYVSMAE